MNRRDEAYMDRLYARAWRIKDEHACGHYLPIFEALAMRGHVWGMIEHADTLARGGRIGHLGTASSFLYRAFRHGEPTAAQHLSRMAFQAGDMKAYRHWLRQAANKGDGDCLKELRCFETRLPHINARLIGRKRPYRKLKDGCWE